MSISAAPATAWLATRPARAVVVRIAGSRAAFGVAISLTFVVLARNLLAGLGSFAIQDWDEARHGISAYEMLQSGNFLVNTYRGAPDYWNLKPPLSFWLDAASMHLFGYSVVAMRLPSTLATIGTVAVVAFVAHRLAGRAAAVIAAVALASSVQLITMHSGRTADPDALYILFMTASVACTLFARRRARLLLGTTTFFSLAFLTKSFHAAIALVFAVVFLALVRRTSLIRWRTVAVALLGFLPVLGWAAWRATYDGFTFLADMFVVDVFNRTTTGVDGNAGGAETYFQLLRANYGPWILVGFAALLVLVGHRKRVDRTLLEGDSAVLVGAGIYVALVVGLFSLPATKPLWYVIPAIPFIGLLTGVLCSRVFQERNRAVTAVLLVGLVFATALTQLDLRDQRRYESSSMPQLALMDLHRSTSRLHQDVYLDPAASGYGADNWTQSMVLAAELGGGLVPRDGGEQAMLSAGTSALVLLQQDSPIATDLAAKGVVRVLTNEQGTELVAFTPR